MRALGEQRRCAIGCSRSSYLIGLRRRVPSCSVHAVAQGPFSRSNDSAAERTREYLYDDQEEVPESEWDGSAQQAQANADDGAGSALMAAARPLHCQLQHMYLERQLPAHYVGDVALKSIKGGRCCGRERSL